MKWHDLVFSDHPKQRYRRHGLFWLLWWLYFVGTFFYSQQGLHQAGSLQWIGIVLLKSLSLLLCHAFMVYSVIYYLLPKYLLKARYTGFIAGLLMAGFIVITWAYICYALLFPLLDTAFHLPSAVTQNILLWNSVAAGLISALKVVMAAASVTLLKYWWLKQKEKERLEKEKINTELQLLKAQIHPDFLFSSLDHIYSFAQTDAKRASELLLKLAEMLSYMLYECNQPLVSLEKEIKMMNDYIRLEKIRMEQKLEIDISVNGEASGKMIIPLLLLPFIENSLFYCYDEKLEKYWINLDLQITENDFSLKLVNGISSDVVSSVQDSSRLANVQRRLEIAYPGCYELKTTISAEIMMTYLRIQWDEAVKNKTEVSLTEERPESNSTHAYATT
ncbi:MAG: histidine kinase [Flavisolibacter sp.]|nr:histidine kinase [Flavisolibacter sp.]